MSLPLPKSDPAGHAALLNEADIGSGEKSPGQLETEKIIASIPPLPDDGDQTGASSRGDPAAANTPGKS